MSFISRIKRIVGSHRLELILLAFLVFSLLIISYYNTWSPYHLDSAVYALAAKTGEIQIGSWRWGLKLTYYLLSFIGDPHVLFTALSIVLFPISIYLFTRKYLKLEKAEALYVSLLLTTIPATLMTLEVGKEDMFIIALSLIAAYLFGESLILSFIGGLIYGLSFASKTGGLLMLPLIIFAIYSIYRRNQREAFKHIIAFSLGALPFLLESYWIAKLWLHNPESENSLSLLGFGSYLLMRGIGIQFYSILLLLLLYSYAFFIDEKTELPLSAVFLLIVGLAIFVQLATNTTVKYRYAIYPFLYIAFSSIILFKKINLSKVFSSTRASSKKLKEGIIFFLSLLSIFQVIKIVPNLEIKHLNLPAKFASAVKDVTPPNAVILGMNNCGLVEYYSGRKCLTHIYYIFNKTADPVEEIKEKFLPIAKKGLLYTYPDWYAYDDGRFVRAFKQFFDLKPIYANWYEDYHWIKYYGGLDWLKWVLETYFGLPSECSISCKPVQEVFVYGLKMNKDYCIASCFEKIVPIGAVLEYKGIYPIWINKDSINKVIVKNLTTTQ